jgi:hypothetical protein
LLLIMLSELPERRFVGRLRRVFVRWDGGDPELEPGCSHPKLTEIQFSV